MKKLSVLWVVLYALFLVTACDSGSDTKVDGDESDGDVEQGECTQGDTKCVGDDVYECSVAMAWQLSQSCSAMGDYVCLYGSCQPRTVGDGDSDEDGDAIDGDAIDGDADVDGDSDIDGDGDDDAPIEGYPDKLPFELTREQEGEPLTQAEITAFTKKITGFWKDSNFFDWVWWTSHGLDASYDENMPDYKLWWQDTQSYMEDGVLRFSHTGGADNLLLRTCKILNSTAAAYLMTGDEKFGRIVEAYSKGIVALSLGMEWGGEGQPAKFLQARAIFTHNHEYEMDGGRKVKVEYDEVKKKYSYSWNAHTIPNPENPYYGEIWLRTMRSKDDVPHFYRSVPMLQRVAEDGKDENVRTAAAEALRYIEGFAKDVVDSGYNIRSVNRCGDVMIPSNGDDSPACPAEEPDCRDECLVDDDACTRHPDCALSCATYDECGVIKDLASFVLFEIFDKDAECNSKLGSALIGYGDTEGNDCAEGISDTYEPLATSQHYFNTHIIRIFHVAAAYNALMRGEYAAAKALIEGLGQRARRDINDEEMRAEEDEWDGDLTAYLVGSAATGMPLTNHEARVIQDVYSYSAEHYATYPYWDPWNAAGLSGQFDYKPERCVPDPNNAGKRLCAIRITEIAHILEYCYSPLRNPAGAQFVDCDVVADPSRWGE